MPHSTHAAQPVDAVFPSTSSPAFRTGTTCSACTRDWVRSSASNRVRPIRTERLAAHAWHSFTTPFQPRPLHGRVYRNGSAKLNGRARRGRLEAGQRKAENFFLKTVRSGSSAKTNGTQRAHSSTVVYLRRSILLS